GRADFKDLRHQCRVIGNPVSHDDPSASSGHAHHLFGHVEWLWREHGAKDAYDEVKHLVLQLMQIGSVSFLKFAVRQIMFPCALVPGLYEVLRNIDAQYLGAEFRRRYRRRSIAASEV